MNMLALARFVGSVSCIFLVPGFLLTYLLPYRYDRLAFPQRLAHAVLYSLSITVFGGFVLTQFRLFTGTALWILWLSIIGVQVILLWHIKFDVRAALHDFLDFLRAVPQTTWLLLLLVAGATILPFLYWNVTSFYPSTPVVWYYYSEAQAILKNHAFPATMLEYGVDMAFLNDKQAYKLIGATLIANAPLTNPPMTVQFTVVFFSHLILIIGMWQLLRRHASPTFTALGIIWVCWLPLTMKMNLYRAEGLGVALFLLTLYFIDRAFETRRLFDAILVALSLSLTALAHYISGMAGVYWYAGMTASLIVFNFKQFKKYLPAMFTTTALTGVLVLGVAAAVGRGHILSQEFHDISIEALPQVEDFPAAFRYLVGQGSTDFPEDIRNIKDQPVTIELVFGQISPYLVLAFSPWFKSVFPVLIIVGLCLAYLTWRGAHVSIAYLGVLFCLVGLTVFFTLNGDSALLRSHIQRRHMPYLALLTAIVFVIALSYLITQISSHLDRVNFRVFWLDRHDLNPGHNPNLTAISPITFVYEQQPAPGIPDKTRISTLIRLTSTLFLLLVLARVITNNFERGEETSRGTELGTSTIDSMAWLNEHTQANDVIASNLYTDGTFHVLAGRVSVTEGRSPYFQPKNLEIALTTLVQFYEFFDHPTLDTLQAYDVDYIVYYKKGAKGGGLFFTPDSEETLDTLIDTPFLELRGIFGNEDHVNDVFIFEVQP